MVGWGSFQTSLLSKLWRTLFSTRFIFNLALFIKKIFRKGECKRVGGGGGGWDVATGTLLDKKHMTHPHGSLKIERPNPLKNYRSDEGLTLGTSAFKLFTVANLRYQLSW